jgi:hypothetical protein
VKHFLDILIDDYPSDSYRHEICCLVSDTTFLPIDLFAVKKPGDRIDVGVMVKNLINGIAEAKPEDILADSYVWFHPVVAIVAATYAEHRVSQVTSNVALMGNQRLHQVEFYINHTFKVVVSSKRPRSTSPQAQYYTHATVDKDDWIVGQSTARKVLATA